MQGDNTSAPTDVQASIYDPGEIDRDSHNKADRITVGISNAFAWLFPILMVAICAQVILRQAGHNQAWLDDLQWWLYGAAVLVGVAYAVTTNSHVRVDIFYDNFTKKRKARIDVFALAWCFLPFAILCWDVTLDYALSSIKANEGSDSPNGLHGLWMLKTFLNVSFLLLIFAIWGAYVRRLSVLTVPTLGRQLLWAFPATMFIVNRVLYHGLYFYHLATLPDGENPRTITKKPIFDAFEIGPWEIRTLFALAFGIAVVLIALALLRDARRSK